MKSTSARVGLFLSILFSLALSSTRPSQSAAALAVAPNTPDVSLLPDSLHFGCSFNPGRGCECTEGLKAKLTNLGDTPVIIKSISPGPGVPAARAVVVSGAKPTIALGL